MESGIESEAQRGDVGGGGDKDEDKDEDRFRNWDSWGGSGVAAGMGIVDRELQVY